MTHEWVTTSLFRVSSEEDINLGVDHPNSAFPSSLEVLQYSMMFQVIIIIQQRLVH